MSDSPYLKWRTRPRQVRLLLLAALAGGALLAACGGSAPSQSAATVGDAGAGAAATTGSSTATPGGVTSSSSAMPSAGGSGPLAFAECMRANGVPNFPDPKGAGGGVFQMPAGSNPAAPAFRAARAKCQKFMGGGPPGPGSTTHPSTRTMAMLRKIAVCMRAHGVPQFPDPRTTVPADPAGAGIAEITDFDDAILLFPTTIDMQAPAYRQALTACGAPPLGLRH
jgi:hypothetical protein